MGKLGMSDSFAEISLLDEELITCSIVTATDMELGVVKPERLHGRWRFLFVCFLFSVKHIVHNNASQILQELLMVEEQANAKKKRLVYGFMVKVG